VLETDERIRIGTSLRRRREALGLDQKDIAQKAEMAIGTVQNIEHAKRKVTREKIDAYAKVVDTTVEELLHPDTVRATDPKWQDLNDEHLAIARQYMKAYKAVRRAVEVLLADDAAARKTMTDLAEMVLALHRVAASDPAVLAGTEVLLGLDDVLVQLAKRLDADPTFERTLRDLLASHPL
jgi:transcriptional regulator with XRE-family HTH domain